MSKNRTATKHTKRKLFEAPSSVVRKQQSQGEKEKGSGLALAAFLEKYDIAWVSVTLCRVLRGGGQGGYVCSGVPVLARKNNGR